MCATLTTYATTFVSAVISKIVGQVQQMYRIRRQGFHFWFGSTYCKFCRIEFRSVSVAFRTFANVVALLPLGFWPDILDPNKIIIIIIIDDNRSVFK